MRCLRHFIAGVVAVSFIAATTGCFGQFALTRKLYKFNEDISDNKFVVSLVMYGMLIIPVYEIGSLGDFIIFNVIEFWSGENPIGEVKIPKVKIDVEKNSQVILDHADRAYTLAPRENHRYEISEGGVALGTAQVHVDGSLTVFNPDNEILYHYARSDIDLLQ